MHTGSNFDPQEAGWGESVGFKGPDFYSEQERHGGSLTTGSEVTSLPDNLNFDNVMSSEMFKQGAVLDKPGEWQKSDENSLSSTTKSNVQETQGDGGVEKTREEKPSSSALQSFGKALSWCGSAMKKAMFATGMPGTVVATVVVSAVGIPTIVSSAHLRKSEESKLQNYNDRRPELEKRKNELHEEAVIQANKNEGSEAHQKAFNSFIAASNELEKLDKKMEAAEKKRDFYDDVNAKANFVVAVPLFTMSVAVSELTRKKN